MRIVVQKYNDHIKMNPALCKKPTHPMYEEWWALRSFQK
ncbi:hypothetical protein BLGI_2156 [Brevibacillus laterosporus GI-9]|nr:hypothetical protein BLGI_2156 [Brevibacillus laterosporus GI-9]